jgi:hypothetical protein
MPFETVDVSVSSCRGVSVSFFQGFYFASLGSSGSMPTIFVCSTSVQRCIRASVETVPSSNVVRISNRSQNRTENVQGRKICQGAMGY